MKYALIAAMAALTAVSGEKPLVVHEWGTFTTVSGADGAPMVWRPLGGPTDLPSFVYRPDYRRGDAGLDKTEFTTTVRMETPVIYFYAGRDTDVSVKVGFPEGAITEWYPRAVSVKRQGMDWGTIRVRPSAPDEFPREAAPSHYYPARETDASPIQVKSPGLAQDEKFLFYRGVGWFQPAVKVSLKNDLVVVKNPGKDPVPAILFENRKGMTGFRVLGAVKDEVAVARPELSQGKSEVMAELERTLVKSGLFEKEARAMLKTWRDSWFEEGMRVFTLVPRAAADKILPLTLDPKPEELVRVFVGRAEILTPEMEQAALATVKRTGEDTGAFWKEVEQFGRFASPLFRRATAQLPPAQVPESVKQLLSRDW
jgi:hypothetical protein